ncbi:MAG TPA: phospholipase D-like domain-containing protein [Candidatus Binatia bacterium]|jgi:phosphatidylserine/phosphatidylglycerophosphate/cardiolipin synthase-like enzyme|nr:phospholipase D-like domain-containing protein [Candidatus Binatia bacterium]
MGQITAAHAYANNEVAYVAWDIDGKITGCLGFEVTRVYLDADGTVARRPDGKEDRVKCAAWVAFKGQRNPHWLPQDTGVWPVQKLSWRDLTLRKKRDGMTRRPDEVLVRYEIRPVGDLRPGLESVPSNGLEFAVVVKRDSTGRPVLGADGKPIKERVKAYEGKPRPLGYLAPATKTNDVRVTSRRGSFRSTFTNGILAAQWLRNVLNEDGVIEKNELLEKISNPNDPHRKYLAGDVIPLIRQLFDRPGTFHLALYELEDKELENILVANATRIHVILANTAVERGQWDARNQAARARLVNAGVDIQHRMFNNTIHIGHNKFVVHVPPGGGPRSVLTGSTNWTATGLAGQTNNALLIDDDAIAGAFFDYWNRLKSDKLKLPNPFSAAMKDSQQGKPFRTSNETVSSFTLASGATVSLWFSPNRPERTKPTFKTKPTPTPPDLAEVYRCMRMAKEAILFLAFYPGQRGTDCIIGEAINIGRKDPSLLVTGAVSSPQAMPNYVPKKKNEDGEVEEEGASPATFDEGKVSIVRASRIDDQSVLGDLGVEQLTAHGTVGAIIHDKILVIDPRLPECTVVLGSHNLGFKASYSNDENMVIVTSDQELAIAYAVHILDVYDHYRFRAIESDQRRKGQKDWSGFLETNDDWQNGYVAGRKGALMRYFAR